MALGAAALTLALTAGAGAHPSATSPSQNGSALDTFLNSGRAEHQATGHGEAGSVPGRKTVPPSEVNLDLIGKIEQVPEFGEMGRVADVSAHGNFAYLTQFYEPTCGLGGVQIVDISNPAAPKERGYIPSHTDTFGGEGSQVVVLDTPYFKGPVLIYQNEICPFSDTTNGVGGITLVDVRNPDKPKKLVEGAGDNTRRSGADTNGKSQVRANETHSAFAWKSAKSGRWYVALVDDEEETDVDILDITNPSRPAKVAEWNFDSEKQEGAGRPYGDAVFSHDLVVEHIGGKDVMLLSYWDGGYVQLDVSDPTTAAPTVLSDTDYVPLDPAAPQRGLTPEGNAHQAEYTRDNKYFFATDEDFNPYRGIAKVTTGLHKDADFTAVSGDASAPIDHTTQIKGATQFVGLGCSAIPAAGTAKIAVIERGVCDFQVKVDFAEAAGYESVIIFNRTGVDGCETLITMLVTSDLPALFVSRTDGFKILGRSLAGYTCDATKTATGTPAGATGPGEEIDIHAVFDGWGYTHMYKAAPNAEGHNDSMGIYFPLENQDPAFATEYGDLSVHEVATDPDADRVYISHYALGLRVLSYDDSGLEAAGSFVEQGGSNYWGVEVHKHPNGQTYVLGSDRDRGLRIFQWKDGHTGNGTL